MGTPGTRFAALLVIVFCALTAGSSAFAVANAPPTGSIHSPTAGAVVDSLNPELRVNASDPDPGDQIYVQFQVSTNSGYTNIVADSGWMPTTWTYTVPDGALHNDIRSASGVTFYWRARAKDTGVRPRLGHLELRRQAVARRRRRQLADLRARPCLRQRGNGQPRRPGAGTSFPTIIGEMGVAPTFNSFNNANTGLGVGWTLGVLGLGGVATKLIDHSVLTGTQKQDAVELVLAHGDRRWFNHVSDTAIYRQRHHETEALLTKNGDGTWTLTEADGTIATYTVVVSAVSKLSSIQYADVDPGLGTMTYSFVSGSDDKVQTITDPGGRTLSFNWSCGTGKLFCVTGPDGVTWTCYHQGGRLSKVNNGTRDLVAYTYDGNTRLQKVENANDLNAAGASPGYLDAHSIQLAYDGSGRVVAVQDGPIHSQPADQQDSLWTFTYHGSANLTATRAAHAGMPQGTVRTASGSTQITPPKQQGLPTPKKTIVYYDGQGQPMQVTDILGNITMSQYDGRGGLVWTEDADGNPSDNTWEPVNDLLLQTQGADPDGAGGPLARPVTAYRYDEKAVGTGSQAGPGLQGLQASYFSNLNLAGRPAARQTDANVDFNWGSGGPTALGSQVDNFSVRWSGNINVTTEGDYTFTTVSSEGARLTVDGIQAIHKWQDQGVTSWSSLPIHLTVGLHPMTLDYYEKTGVAEAHLRWSCTGCSPSIPDQVIPAASLQPAWNNETSAVSPLGKVGFSHVADPAKSLSDYTLVKDGSTNVITSFAYDAYGRMTQKVMPKGNAGRTIDADGNLLGSPDASFATSFVYFAVTETAAPPGACGGGSAVNQSGLPKSKTPFGIAETSYVYNSRGQEIARTNGAGTSCSTFTNEARLSSTKAPGESQSTTYAYDPVGALRTAIDTSGTLTTEYDEAGRSHQVGRLLRRRGDPLVRQARKRHPASGEGNIDRNELLDLVRLRRRRSAHEHDRPGQQGLRLLLRLALQPQGDAVPERHLLMVRLQPGGLANSALQPPRHALSPTARKRALGCQPDCRLFLRLRARGQKDARGANRRRPDIRDELVRVRRRWPAEADNASRRRRPRLLLRSGLQPHLHCGELADGGHLRI